MTSAKKYFGQNWLNSPHALAKIITAGNVSPADLIIEIGPGTGALTKKLLATGATVIAIEIDAELVLELKNTFMTEIKNQQLILIEGDILKMDLKKIVGKKSYKLIANIPYYITGAIIEYFLQSTYQPVLAVLLVQKEVAKRIVADNQKESILSLSVKVFGTPKYIATVPAGAFIPTPKVDSAILAISDIKNSLSASETARFFNLIKQGFAGKRKQLKNNLPNLINKFSECNIKPTDRAENLTLTHWLCLLKNSN